MDQHDSARNEVVVVGKEPSLVVHTEYGEHNLGQKPPVNCALTQEFEQEISHAQMDGLSSVAQYSFVAACSMREATYKMIGSTDDTLHLNENFNMFNLSLKYAECMEASKLAMISCRTACREVLDYSTTGFLYAIEGHNERALKKFTLASKMAEGMKKTIIELQTKMKEVAEKTKEMRGDMVLTKIHEAEKRSKATTANFVEQSRNAKETKTKVTDLQKTIDELKKQWFPGDEPEIRAQEKKALEEKLKSINDKRDAAQNDLLSAESSCERLRDAANAFRKCEVGLERQKTFWEAVNEFYEKMKDKLEALDSTSQEGVGNLLTMEGFKCEAYVTHCWFQALSRQLKPGIQLMGECVTRFYDKVTDYPRSLKDAKARLPEMIEAHERDKEEFQARIEEIEGRSASGAGTETTKKIGEDCKVSRRRVQEQPKPGRDETDKGLPDANADTSSTLPNQPVTTGVRQEEWKFLAILLLFVILLWFWTK